MNIRQIRGQESDESPDIREFQCISQPPAARLTKFTGTTDWTPHW